MHHTDFYELFCKEDRDKDNIKDVIRHNKKFIRQTRKIK